MGSYNYFFAKCACSNCRSTLVADFQAVVGILQFKDFQIGDSVLEADFREWKGRVGPDVKPFVENLDFWAYGVAQCPVCKAYFWGKLFFRQGKFDQVQVVEEPNNSFDWGILEE